MNERTMLKQIHQVMKFLFLVLFCSLQMLLNAQQVDLKSRVLKAKGDYYFAPLEFIDKSGKPTGFNVELIDSLMKRAHLQYTLELDDWDNVLSELENNTIDLAIGMGYTEERASKFKFGIPHAMMSYAITSRKEDSYVDVSDLKGKTIIVQKSDMSQAYILSNQLTEHLVEVDDITEALELLESGTHDAFLSFYKTVSYYAKKKDYPNLVVSKTDIPSVRYSIAVSSNNEELLYLLNNAIYHMKKDGSYDKLYNKWFEPKQRTYRYALTVTGVMIVILLIIGLIIYATLKRKLSKAHTHLLAYNEQLSLILDNLPIPIAIKDPRCNKYTYVNKATSAQFGAKVGDSPNDVYATLRCTPHNEADLIANKKSFSALERMTLFDGRVFETLITKTPVAYHGKTQLLLSRLDLTEVNKESRDSRLIDTLMPMMKAYTWCIDSRYPSVINTYHNMVLERDISNLESDMQFIEAVHMEDRALFIAQCKKLITASPESVKSFQMRLDLEKIGVYEWWESYVAIEVLHQADKAYRVVRGITINVNERKLAEAELVSQQQSIYTLSNSLPFMQAFYWYMDMRKAIHYHSALKLERDVNLLTDVFQYLSFIHPEDRERIMEKYDEQLLLDRGTRSFLYRIDLKKIGVYEWWETTATIETRYDAEGKSYKFLCGLTINVHEREIKAEQFKQLALTNNIIITHADTGLVFMDREYNIHWSNLDERFPHAFPGKFEVEHTCQKGLGHGEKCKGCMAHQAWETRRPVVFVEENCLGYSFENSYIPVFDNEKIVGIVATLKNVSEHVELVHKLSEAKELAEKADKLKSAFLANMSHEIRTPLNAIVGFSELLQTATDPAEKEEYIGIINTNNDLLLRLINDILDLSKIESGTSELKYEQFDFSHFFEEAYAMLAPRFFRSEVYLKHKNPFEKCVVTLDRSRVLQILTNYLTNAFKYTTAGEVLMSYDYQDGAIWLEVKDTGIGIAADKMNLLFQRFEKLDQFAQGTGLGLSICKALAESMKGEVGASSTVGIGSLFWAKIPCELDS